MLKKEDEGKKMKKKMYQPVESFSLTLVLIKGETNY